MEISGWKYYNHAAISTAAPHEEVDLAPIKDGSIWNLDGSPILARWTSDFDCGRETNWWYIVREAPFDLDEVSSKDRKRVRQALTKCYVKRQLLSDNTELLYGCYIAAHKKYLKADKASTYEEFDEWCQKNDKRLDCWCGYDNETNLMIGFITVERFETHADTITAKFNPEYSSRQVSDALYYHILEYYLNDLGLRYVSSGTRNIQHQTNTQEYKIRRFGYKKAYCKLNVAYSPKIKWVVKLLFPFRKILTLFDKVRICHKINGVLKMEAIVRNKE